MAGDTHGNSQHMQNVFAHACRVEAEIVFQLGDFGYGWGFSQRKGTGEKYDTFTDNVAKFVKRTGGIATREIPCYWLPGNHENYDALDALVDTLDAQPDGTYEIEPSVFYVPRGTVLTLDGVRFLCCGGATSVDKKMRIPFVSWWEQEAITDEDVATCADAGTADVLLSHDFPWECNIVDRHLDDFWGVEAQINTEASRKRISQIAVNAGVRRIFHGHLHIKYNESIELNGQSVLVSGLDCDGNSMNSSTMLVDTEWPSVRGSVS